MKKMPIILQRDAIQCGVSCLQMICKYYLTDSFQEIEKLCVPTTEGVSLLGIKETAEHIGFSTKCCQLALKVLNKSREPCILHWNQNHFVVLYKVKRGRIFYVADPAKGLVRYTLDEFKRFWVSTQSGGEEKGIAIFLEPTPAF